jgi:hypothetical protein
MHSLVVFGPVFFSASQRNSNGIHRFHRTFLAAPLLCHAVALAWLRRERFHREWTRTGTNGEAQLTNCSDEAGDLCFAPRGSVLDCGAKRSRSQGDRGTFQF